MATPIPRLTASRDVRYLVTKEGFAGNADSRHQTALIAIAGHSFAGSYAAIWSTMPCNAKMPVMAIPAPNKTPIHVCGRSEAVIAKVANNVRQAPVLWPLTAR